MTLPPPSSQTTAGPGIATALGRIPSGLFVVAWRDGEFDRAMLASWVMQAGFAPPAVSVAVAPSRDLMAAVERGGAFAISVLADTQRPLLARFGKPTAEAFAGLDVERTPSGLAVLAAAAAWLECRPAARVEHGDHVIVVADVVAGGGATGEPLVHLRKNGLRY
jgi:flavin reductase (DIM6/NTAB) family NADH-FMN oxidoreductase RutF